MKYSLVLPIATHSIVINYLSCIARINIMTSPRYLVNWCRLSLEWRLWQTKFTYKNVWKKNQSFSFRYNSMLLFYIGYFSMSMSENPNFRLDSINQHRIELSISIIDSSLPWRDMIMELTKERYDHGERWPWNDHEERPIVGVFGALWHVNTRRSICANCGRVNPTQAKEEIDDQPIMESDDHGEFPKRWQKSLKLLKSTHH